MFPHERSLVQRLEGKPFVLLGADVGDDRGKVQQQQKDGSITWRSFWDEPGQIAERWSVALFPTIYLIDHRGVVRWVGSKGDGLDEAVDQLVREAETEPTPVADIAVKRR